MNPIKIIKNRSDIGAGTRGSDMGIDAIEIAAINTENNFFNIHPYIDIQTHNETVYNKNKNTFAKRINFVCEQCERLRDGGKKDLQKGVDRTLETTNEELKDASHLSYTNNPEDLKECNIFIFS